MSTKNKEQVAAFWAAVKDKKNIFLTGGGGVGKSYLINSLRKKKELGWRIAVTATTGIAAVNIHGSTIHSWAGIGTGPTPLETFKKFFAKVSSGANFHRSIQRIMSTDILVIDEISMMSPELLDYLDYHLRRITDTQEAFGGLQVIVVGDFYQLPPVNKTNNSDQYAFQALSWASAKFEMIELKEIWRQNDERFISLLQRARTGNLADADISALAMRQLPPADDVPRTYPINATTDQYNAMKLAEIDSKPVVFRAIVSGNRHKAESQLIRNLITPENLELKVGARVICTANMTNQDGKEVYNGMLGTVISISPVRGGVLICTGDPDDVNESNSYWIPMYTWELIEGNDVVAAFKQYPLKLAWALTIHKMQGASVDKLAIDMSRIFAHGQAYVALSRVRTLQGLYLTGFHPSKVVASGAVREYYNNPDAYNKREVVLPYIETKPERNTVDMSAVPREEIPDLPSPF